MFTHSTKVSVYSDSWGAEKWPSVSTPDTKKSSSEAKKSTPESQKYLEAKELYDDKKLSADVEKLQKLIAEGNISELKNQLKNYRVEGIGNLEVAITKIDLLGRAKDGRVISVQKEGFVNPVEESTIVNALVKNGSNLAKLIQIYILANDASVQFQDFKKSLAGIDGNLERFTMQWLTQVIGSLKNKQALEGLRQEVDNKTRSGPLKAMGVDVETNIRNTSTVNEDLRKRREMSVDLAWDNLILWSYGNISRVDLTTGKIALGDLPSKEYPLTVHLVRDRDNKQNPLMIASEVNRNNIKNAMKLVNLVHFIVSEFMNEEKKKSLRDTETPFYIGTDWTFQKGNLKVKDGTVNPTDITKEETLTALLKDARTNTVLDPEILARFLNDIFRAKNPQTTIDRWSTHVGKGKAISSTP
jgi:hypothetical protein